MLRTTNKLVTEGLRIHILESFAETAEYERDHGNVNATPLSCLQHQIDSMRYGNRSVHATALDYVEGGSLLVYYGEAREFLKDLLQETALEAGRDDEKVWKLYCYLVAREMSNLYTLAGEGITA